MKGFALIEVLITLFILSLGLLAIVGMQLTALRQGQEAYFRSLAMVQLSAMAERLRFNQLDSYRRAELTRWNEINAKLLPYAKGTYQCGSDMCLIDLEWQFLKKPESLSIALFLEPFHF